MDIGFIGLGAMGAAMVANLLEKGHAVTVWNRSQTPVQDLAALGATPAGSVEETLQGDVVFSMLADDQALQDVLLDSGALAKARPGLVHVNLATISVALAHDLVGRHARSGLGYVAAPVFGRPAVARAGGLNILAAGEAGAVARVTPLLEALAAKVWPMGEDPVRANVVKLAGNLMLVSAVEAMGEAAALGRAHGVPASDLLDMLTGSLFAAPAYKIYAPMIVEERYQPAGFKLGLALKDVRLALAAGDAASLALPLASLARDSLLDAQAHGGSDQDLAALAGVSARRVSLADEA
ncbi:MAG: NAD(P)-dependent oxidoreductase [bacterium]|nr:NAD(P)-dependent oxidoreductase [bacterium]